MEWLYRVQKKRGVQRVQRRWPQVHRNTGAAETTNAQDYAPCPKEILKSLPLSVVYPSSFAKRNRIVMGSAPVVNTNTIGVSHVDML